MSQKLWSVSAQLATPLEILLFPLFILTLIVPFFLENWDFLHLTPK